MRYTTVCKEKNFTGGDFLEKDKSLREPDELVELSNLYDFYGALLKENHRRVFEDYVWHNYSLAEIAGEQQMTRQGVYDIVRRCRTKLRGYEEKLHLVEKFQVMKVKLQQMEEVAGRGQDEALSKEIAVLAEEIYDII